MWAHLTLFYAGGPELAAAWGFIGAAQPLAQVLAKSFAMAPCLNLHRLVIERRIPLSCDCEYAKVLITLYFLADVLESVPQ